MTSHELARRLLAGPDLPVFVWNYEDNTPAPVWGVDVQDVTSHHLWRPSPTEDNSTEPAGAFVELYANVENS